MKLIEAMKLIKELQVKADDLRKKVGQYCADLDYETPLYPDQKRQVSEWIQSHSDITKKILELRTSIQKTNLATTVAIELGGKTVTKTIAEWIHRRRDLAKSELEMWSKLTDRNLKEGAIPSTMAGGEAKAVKIRRYFDPLERDKAIELYRTEPGIIDRTLEVINAITSVIVETPSPKL
jgi:hypothetical protein